MEAKVARTLQEVLDVQDNRIDGPSGWIQWKGTEVCMDVYCKCGESSHIDAEFLYYVKCPACGTVYSCNPNIELIEVMFEVDAKEAEL